MRIAVLLTVHNRREKTVKCLESFVSQKYYDKSLFDIYMVDDGSNDGTSKTVSEVFPDIIIIQGNGELFWNRGMLLAWKTAIKAYDYDGYLWLNDDVELFPCALEQLLTYYKQFQDSIIAGAMCSTSDRSSITYSGYIKNRSERLVPKKEALPCDCFNGNVVFIPRSVYEKVGTLDPYFRHSCGDYEYGYRAKKLGVKSYVIPPVGMCDRNPGNPKWISSNLSVFQRLKQLYSPIGNNPFEEYKVARYESFWNAIGIFVYLHIKALFPKFNTK